MKDEFECNIFDLPDGSQTLVTVKCDYCGSVFKKPWQRHHCELGEVGTDACSACRGKKMKASNLLKYGTEDAAHLPEVNNKRNATNLEKYGCINPFSNQVVKEKIKQHWIDMFGVSSYTQTDEYMEKMKETCMRKYGVTNPGQIHPLKGEASPCWKGGATYHRQERSTDEYRKWRKAVYERDHFICRACNEHKQELEAHHLYNWKDYPDLRYCIDNGVTLCKQCHALFHSTYGKKDNTPEQFMEFICQGENVC